MPVAKEVAVERHGEAVVGREGAAVWVEAADHDDAVAELDAPRVREREHDHYHAHLRKAPAHADILAQRGPEHPPRLPHPRGLRRRSQRVC